MHPDEHLLDISYSDNFNETLNPWFINYICAIHAYPTPGPNKGFDYCELGCGNGLTSNILAAANPGGRFVGIDMNPEHIANARRAMEEGGLSNLTPIEENFANLPSADLPDFDFITMPRVVSLVSPQVLEKVAAFIERKLRPGGMVMVSYNTPQGWSVIAPLRDFLRDCLGSGGGDLLEKAKRGLEELCFLRDAGVGFFKMNLLAGMALDSLLHLDLNFLVNEFLVPYWHPLYFSDVRDRMAQAGLEFTGSLPVAGNYAQICIARELHEYFGSLPDRPAFEMRKDFANMTLLRNDVYCKGSRNPKLSHVGKFKGLTFGSFLGKEDFQFKFEIPGYSSINLEGPRFEKLAGVIAGKSMRLEDLMNRPELDRDSPEEIVAALEWLVATGQVMPSARVHPCSGREAANSFALSRFNRSVLLRELPKNKRSIHLASWTAGSGVSLGRKEALALLALSEAGVEGAENWAGLWSVRNNPVDDGKRNPLPLSEVIRNIVAEPACYAALGINEPPPGGGTGTDFGEFHS